MQLYSTNDPSIRADFATAVFRAMPPDGGLYMPVGISELPDSFWASLPERSLPEVGFTLAQNLLGGAIEDAELKRIIDVAIDFPAPLVELRASDSGDARSSDAQLPYILELFQGPSQAFKDFGARFMAGVMGHLLGTAGKRLLILVATSGDTGGAVAAGFAGQSDIDVVILYPAGAVSDVQEAQLTTQGENVHALRVAGTFDDCQALVKQAFVDHELRGRIDLSSANSINISRLIPQSFYYVEAYRQWRARGHTEPPVFAVPSGNFGNLTAGLLAMRMGMPVQRFVAGTNANDTVARYARDGVYEPRPSVATLSNAMDVGAPSNFVRMSELFGSTWNVFKKHISAYSFTDAQTEAEMRAFAKTNLDPRTGRGYVLDPHTAVGTLALKRYVDENGGSDVPGIVLATAHPAKFRVDVERILGGPIEVPEVLARLMELPRTVRDVEADYKSLRGEIERVWKRGAE